MFKLTTVIGHTVDFQLKVSLLLSSCLKRLMEFRSVMSLGKEFQICTAL